MTNLSTFQSIRKAVWDMDEIITRSQIDTNIRQECDIQLSHHAWRRIGPVWDAIRITIGGEQRFFLS